MNQPTDRDQTIQGLRKLADFLDANPDAPIRSGLSVQYSVDATLARDGRTSYGERRAEVNRVAKVLGVEACADGPHYVAERSFGGITYLAASCDPGPKPGKCSECKTRPVHRPGSELVTGRTCTTCLTPHIAEAIDRAAEIDEAHAAANEIEHGTEISA